VFRSLARFVTRYPWLVVALWLVGAAAALFAGPSYSAAAARQHFAALPPEAESQRVAQLAAAKYPPRDDRATGILVIEDGAGVGPRTRQLAADLAAWLTDATGGPGHVALVQAPTDAEHAAFLTSADRQAAIVVVTFDSADGAALKGTIEAIEKHLAGLPLAAGEKVGFTGQLAISHDLNASLFGAGGANAGASAGRLLGIVLVLAVLAFVYRSPLAALTPLVAIGFVVAVGPSVIAGAADTFGLPITDFSLPFVFVVTLGAGTNYGLFLISRYREELRRGFARREALEQALARVGEAIASSAATVVLAMGLMGFARLDLFRTLGPAVAISVALMLLAGLTLLPALMALFGRAFFWPVGPKPVADGESVGSGTTLWTRLGRAVVARPAVVALVAVAVLLPFAVSALGAQPSFDNLAALPQDTPAVAGFALYRAHFRDQLAQVSLYLNAPGRDLRGMDGRAVVARLSEALQSVPGVGSVQSAARPAPRQAADAFFAADGSAVRFDVTIGADAESPEAIAVVNDLEATARRVLREVNLTGGEILAAGQPAESRDSAAQLDRDFWLVAGLVSVAVFLVLMLLLRSLTAPVYLLLTIALSTGAAIGLTTLIYQRLLHLPVFFTTPLFGFVFLVALGEDFNIFTMSRLREETRHAGLREGIVRAVGHTGGVVSSCGLVMAASFFLFLRNPVVIVQQIGTVVIAGVLLDTFLVRPILVPAIARLLGRWNWLWIPNPFAGRRAPAASAHSSGADFGGQAASRESR
jgi:uncharacterized membrane protein YdfJ with MMPL/SSD domain